MTKKRWGDGAKFMLRTGVSAGTSTRELWSQSHLPSISESPAHRLGVSLSTFQLFSGSCGLINLFLPGLTLALISSPSYSTMQLESSPHPTHMADKPPTSRQSPSAQACGPDPSSSARPLLSSIIQQCFLRQGPSRLMSIHTAGCRLALPKLCSLRCGPQVSPPLLPPSFWQASHCMVLLCFQHSLPPWRGPWRRPGQMQLWRPTPAPQPQVLNQSLIKNLVSDIH